MNHYKLIVFLTAQQAGPSGYVFCRDLAQARANAAQLLAMNPGHARVEIHLDDELLCEVTRHNWLSPVTPRRL
jgi:hypothetical protein